jgi:hypothetical protein
MKFLRDCKNYDMFGSGHNWTLFGKEKHKSNFGLALTLLLCFILLIKLILLFRKILQKEDYTIMRTDTFDNEPFLNISDLNFAICLEEMFNKRDPVPMKEHFQVLIQLINMTDFDSSKNLANAGICSELPQKDIPSPFNSPYYKDCFCFINNNNTLLNFQDSLLSIGFYGSNSNVSSDSSPSNFMLHYKDYYFDYNSTEKINSFTNIDVNPLYGAKWYYLNKLGYNDGARNYLDMFPIDGEDIYKYKFSSRSALITEGRDKHFFEFLFTFSRKKIFYEVSFMNADDFLAVFGGAFQIFSVVFIFTGQIFNQRSLNIFLIRKIEEIKTSIYNDKTLVELMSKKEGNELKTFKQSHEFIKFKETPSINDGINIEKDSKRKIEEIIKLEENQVQNTKTMEKVNPDIFLESLDLQNFINVYSELSLMKILMFGEPSYIKSFEKASQIALFQKNNGSKYFTSIDHSYHNLSFYERLKIFLSNDKFKL